MKGNRGICPHCHSVGPLGEPCDSHACREPGFGFIPEFYFTLLNEQPAAFRDPWIGRYLEEYLLIDKLGDGAFSRVYLALQLPILMKAAVKVLVPRNGERSVVPEDLELLEVEAKALARLSHPNIVRMLKYGGQSDPPYIAMEYVESSRSLNDELYEYSCRDEWPDNETAWHLLRQVLHALQAIHSLGVMHGDINPNNIMLQNIPGYTRFVRIVDFGLGRLMDEEDEKSDFIFGTDAYIAPETIVGEATGPWTDLYAVGVLAYLLFFSDFPFQFDNREELLDLKEDPDFDPAELLVDENYPQIVLDFFRRALAVNPLERYRQASEFLKDLEVVMEGFGVEED